MTGRHRVEVLKGNTALSRNEKASVLSSPPALCFVRHQYSKIMTDSAENQERHILFISAIFSVLPISRFR